jgi:putative hydrolase of the HAD superfamily
MNRIKVVLFDYDGVMTIDKTEIESICNYISKVMNIDKNLFENEYRKYYQELLYGKQTIEIWDQLCKNIKKNIPIDVVFDSYKNTTINKEMHELVLKIKRQNIKTGLITTSIAERIYYINNIYDLNGYFNIILFPGKFRYENEFDKMFKIALVDLKAKPDECIYIDNHENNLIVPKNMGIKTIFFNDEERDIHKLINELKKYEIL